MRNYRIAAIPDDVTLWGLCLPICQGFDQHADVHPIRILSGSIGTNTNAAALMVAEKAAGLIPAGRCRAFAGLSGFGWASAPERA